MSGRLSPWKLRPGEAERDKTMVWRGVLLAWLQLYRQIIMPSHISVAKAPRIPPAHCCDRHFIFLRGCRA